MNERYAEEGCVRCGGARVPNSALCASCIAALEIPELTAEPKRFAE
ncbi:MAG: hypothetical protein KGI73_03900 [Patescibacteria group bacterium]|nr:hypothetical protein [Patescibacteria group bacterium]